MGVADGDVEGGPCAWGNVVPGVFERVQEAVLLSAGAEAFGGDIEGRPVLEEDLDDLITALAGGKVDGVEAPSYHIRGVPR